MGHAPASASTPPLTMLAVNDGRIVDARNSPVRLRGTCLGGWMNMENFINGFPGTEHGMRAAMAATLGKERAQWFFDRWLDYFLAEDDIAFITSCGATVVRLPLNYRHFESDAEPCRYLEAGFARLDRVLDWCDRHRLYVILDLHAAQGWQSPDWHCDNATRHALFWQYAHFQDRFVALWEEFARRYRGNPVVAGYNVMNEPVTGSVRSRFRDAYTPDWAALNGLYRRVAAAIRAIDPDHLLFLEGDCFSTKFDGLDPPPTHHVVAASHNYTVAGFGPGPYPGEFDGERWDRRKQTAVAQAHEGWRYAAQHGVPLWAGEFGSVFNGPQAEHPDRLRAVDDQMDAFNELGIHWTTWMYKDLGAMGWLAVDPDSAYSRAIANVTRIKEALGTDSWMYWLPPTPAKRHVAELGVLIERTVGDARVVAADHQTYLRQAVSDTYAGNLVQPAFALCFDGKSDAELDRILQSFAFSRCVIRREYIDILKMRLAAQTPATTAR